MKPHEKITLKIYQFFPECIFPEPFKEYCANIAERELLTAKQELIRKKWEQARLERKLQELRQNK